MLFFATYTAINFPYTYITMEGDSLWILTWDYWQLKLAMLPALTNWLAEYLIQFYRSPYLAASIEALVLGAIGLLAYFILKASPRGGWVGTGWLGLLPPILLGFYCTFNLSFQLQSLFFFAFLYGFTLIPTFKGKLLASIISVPVGFMLMQTPMLALLLIVALLRLPQKGEIWKPSLKAIGMGLLPLILLALTPLVYSQQVAFIPFDKRYTYLDCHFNPLTGLYNKNAETLKKFVCLANEGRWEDLLYKEHTRRDAQRGNARALRYALLAECALGTLPENLLDYPIREESQFLYQHEQNYISLQLNRLFYLNLGIYDEAFHHAQEYSLLTTNGDCFSSLRQMIDYSIEEGEWEIADKYLHILSKSSCHKDFVRERRERIHKATSTRGGLEESVPLRADNFVGGYPLPIEMLRLARYYKDSPNRKKMVDYAICSYILRGDVKSFRIAIQAFDIYKDKELPRAYREFMSAYTK